MRRLTAIGSIAFLALFSSYAIAQHEGHADMEAVVDAINGEFKECWDNTDAAACAALYTEDGESMDPAGMIYKGRAAIEAGLAETFTQFGDSKITIERTSLHVVNDTLVVADGTWTVSAGAEGMPTNGFFTMFVTQVDGEWLVAADQAKVAPPMPE